MHDMTARDAEREEMEARRKPELLEHMVADTVIGDWKLTIAEEVDENTGEIYARYWEAKCLHDPASVETQDDILSLVEFLIGLLPPAETLLHDAYLITADLHAQMHTYWKEYLMERGAA